MVESPTEGKPTMTTTTINWHGTNGNRFAFVEHSNRSYTIRDTGAGFDVYEDIDGDDCHLTWQPVLSTAIDYINMHAQDN